MTELFRLKVLGSRKFVREQKGNALMVNMEVNVSGTGRAETNINGPSDLSLTLSSLLSCFHAFLLLCFLYFALSERKSGVIRSFGLETFERL